MAAAYKAPRHIKGGKHARRVATHNQHRRSGVHKWLTRRVQGKLFRGRTVNAPKNIW